MPIRRTNENLNTAVYFDSIWKERQQQYDKVRLYELGRHIRPNARIVDIGAGVCGVAEWYYLYRPIVNVEWFAIDFSPEARNQTLKKCPVFNYILSDARYVPLPSDWFDVVIAGELIEHMERPSELVTELVRLTKPGGYITISSVRHDCSAAQKYPYPEHIWAFNGEDLEKLFIPYGKPKIEIVGNYWFVDLQVQK